MRRLKRQVIITLQRRHDESVRHGKQVQTGDLAAFETLVRQFQDMGVGYAHALMGDFHIAEGIAQKSFFQNYRDLNKLEKPAAFPSWFHRYHSTVHCREQGVY